jgi:hypothetical protein
MDDETVTGAAIMLLIFAAGLVGFGLGWWLG